MSIAVHNQAPSHFLKKILVTICVSLCYNISLKTQVAHKIKTSKIKQTKIMASKIKLTKKTFDIRKKAKKLEY